MMITLGSLNLRRIKETDLEMVREWRMRPGITKWMYTDPKISKEDQITWFNKIKASKENIVFIVEFKEKPVGVCSVNDIDKVNRRASWAFYLAENPHIGLGAVVEYMLIDFVFDALGLIKLSAEVFSENKHVISMHEKFGFKKVGLRKDHIIKNKDLFDVVEMDLLFSEWNPRKFSKIIQRFCDE